MYTYINMYSFFLHATLKVSRGHTAPFHNPGGLHLLSQQLSLDLPAPGGSLLLQMWSFRVKMKQRSSCPPRGQHINQLIFISKYFSFML